MAYQTKYWVWTLNNPLSNDIPNGWSDHVAYAVWQVEKGKSGTLHLQGYLELKIKKTLTFVKGLNRSCHFEQRKGSQDQAIAYCQKEETRIEGPWTYGEKAGNKESKQAGLTQNQLKRCAADIKDKTMTFNEVAHQYPELVIRFPQGITRLCAAVGGNATRAEGCRGVWYVGPSGSGKSRKAYDDHPDAYRKAQNKWWDGYEHQKIVILDDLDTGGKCLGHYLKIWGDRYPASGEIKGGTVNLQHQKIIVTTNYTIEELWGDDADMCASIRRRFEVVQFGEETDTKYQFDTQSNGKRRRTSK